MKQQIRLSDHFTYRKLLRFVLPSIIMMIFTSIYGVVDGLFVSNFAGKTAFAAINLVMPFIMVLGGIGFMIGTGGTALVSKTLGEGQQEEANRYFSMMICLPYSVLSVCVQWRNFSAQRRKCWMTACAMDGLSLRSQARSCCRMYSRVF